MKVAGTFGPAGQNEVAEWSADTRRGVDPRLQIRDPRRRQLRQLRWASPGTRRRRGQMRSDCEEVRLKGAKPARASPRPQTCSCASPINVLSSSTDPYASTRGSSLATRPPPKKPVWPPSPRRV